ncbi:MAG TPA: BON domain-containing protein, partial [Pyrinomonadaceae bacterium]|nr:BON domain-containing protein [Pyrinomonadaceae bacterium]
TKMRRLTVFVLALAVLALASACSAGDNANNTNGNAANANRANANAVNANANANTNANANANTASGGVYNRNYNSKDDYTREDANYRAEAKNAGSSIGQGVEDGWIHFKTRTALATVDDLRDSTINVDVDNNVVTLRGTVANAAQKAKAATEAKKIDGVKNVVNKLEVKADGDANRGNANANGNANRK